MDYTNETVKNIIDSIADSDDFNKVPNTTFEVWCVGYLKNDMVEGTEMLTATFDNPNEAMNYAKNLTLSDILDIEEAAEDFNIDNEIYAEVDRISVEVEAVIDDEDDDAMNIGTIYCKYISLNESDDELEPESCEDAVQLTSNDYTLLEDGSLLVPCNLMQGYNKNDYVRIRFIDEEANPLLTYKIVSRTTGDFEGVDAFVCEFEY